MTMMRLRVHQKGLLFIAEATVACVVAVFVLVGFYTTYGSYIQKARSLHLKEVATDLAASELCEMKAQSELWYQPTSRESSVNKETYLFKIVSESHLVSGTDTQELNVTVLWSEQAHNRQVKVSELWKCREPKKP